MEHNSGERDFHHPYQPYSIQTEFMNAVYDCLEQGKIGILESPTGTGKSLSLICGSLTWLRDHQRRVFQDGNVLDVSPADEPSWIVEHARIQRQQEALQRRQELDVRIAKIRALEKKQRERSQTSEVNTKRRRLESAIIHDQDEARFALEDYESDRDSDTKPSLSTYTGSGLSHDTIALMQSLGFSTDGAKNEEEENPMLNETKIFFCSRTHSQLTQFSGELKRVHIPSALKTDNVSDVEASLMDQVKYITLGSRKNLCINEKVSRLSSTSAMNERCLELQQETEVRKRCAFLPNKENNALLHDFRDHALADIRDIENLASLGKKLSICPYYAARPASKHCEIVTLPYPLLLQKSSRDALGLSLRDHIVIVDEAHNLMDAIAGIYSVAVNLNQIQKARMQLTVYLQKFRNRLKGKNRVYVAQVIRILDSISEYLQNLNIVRGASEGLADIVSIMSGKGVDQINLFKLNTYLQNSRLARKVDGYTAYTEELTGHKDTPDKCGESMNKTPERKPSHNVPILMHVQSFLLALTNPSAEGRFFYSREEDASIQLRYMLLDPTFHFKDIVEEARAVILAGGTMSPMNDYKQHLLSYLDPSSILTLSCNHVIPSTNLLVVPVVHTSTGRDLSFTFESRSKETTITELGSSILTFLRNIPDGVVVFFPSYAYLDECVATWKQLSPIKSTRTYWDLIADEKPIYLEQRSQQSATSHGQQTQDGTVDSLLIQYGAAVARSSGQGAVMFAVIGGSLSEGINFSDSLGRGVIVVGLPFPNPHSTEWKAKMQYVSTKATESGRDGKAAARDYYENACMRAVNQCIGRAIRHKADYAAILMLDKRYGTARIQSKLPQWIQTSLLKSMPAKEAVPELQMFFSGRSL